MIIEAHSLPLSSDEYILVKGCESFLLKRCLTWQPAFTAPPENVRDHVTAATRALTKGDFEKDFEDQRGALRTYLLIYSASYESMGLHHLAVMFDLSENQVHIFMNKMMIAEELHANWDQPTRCIVFHDVQHNRFQTFSFQLTEKLDVLAESKERLWRLGPVVAGLDLSKRRRDINQEYAGRGGGGK
ncbi:hypothetical protein Bca101_045388 [Brassica carinata]